MDHNIERYRSPFSSPLFGIEPFNPFPGRRGFLDNMFDTGFSFSHLADLFDSDFGVKIVDHDDRKEYQFGLPGIRKENISVDISGNVLSIKVSQKEDESSRSYSSKVTLAPDLDVEHAEAESRNGLLSVSFPYLRKNSFKVEVTSGNKDEEKIAVTSSKREDSKEEEDTFQENHPVDIDSSIPEKPNGSPQEHQI
jgi:HSP20 family molecular chaperone IbpA